MNRIIKKIAGVIAVAALPVAAGAQDIHFSQFYETTILRNPALTGIFSGDYKLGASYRSQWNSISNPFQTAMISAETRFGINKEVNDFISVGLLSYYDKAGSIGLKTLSIYPAVNYNKSLEDNYNSFLSVGFTGGFMQRSFDASKVTTDNQYLGNDFNANNPTGENFNSPQVNNFDLGAGVSFSSSTGNDSRRNISYYVGVSGYHFTQPKNSFMGDNTVNLDMKWNLTGGMSMAIDENYNFQFHANYMKQGPYNEVIAGGLLGWGKKDIDDEIAFGIFVGAFYRVLNNDALVPVCKIKYKDYTFGVSYDVNISNVSALTNSRGGYEITAFKTGLFNDPERNKARTICPHSFW